MWNWLKRREAAVELRPWEIGDIKAILEIEDQGPYPINLATLAEWICGDSVYGIVVTEDCVVRGFAAVFLPKIPQAHIQSLRVDKNNLRRGFGTRILHHLRCGIAVWGKVLLRADIFEENVVAHKFLTGKNGFVATIIHAYKDNHGNPMDVFYTFEYPPSNGWREGTIRISTNDGMQIKHFTKTP
jgi:GNAT superfamily N-acetyltransferase